MFSPDDKQMDDVCKFFDIFLNTNVYTELVINKMNELFTIINVMVNLEAVLQTNDLLT